MKNNIKLVIAIIQFIMLFIGFFLMFSTAVKFMDLEFSGVDTIYKGKAKVIGNTPVTIIFGSWVNAIPYVLMPLCVVLLIGETCVVGSENEKHQLLHKIFKFTEAAFMTIALILLCMVKVFCTPTTKIHIDGLSSMSNWDLGGGAITAIVFMAVCLILQIVRILVKDDIVEEETVTTSNKLYQGKSIAELKAELEAELNQRNTEATPETIEQFKAEATSKSESE